MCHLFAEQHVMNCTFFTLGFSYCESDVCLPEAKALHEVKGTAARRCIENNREVVIVVCP